ncbi:tRNA (uracil) methyltransferase [Aspergillus chevalieri]|uniref:tRNA (uracil-O(2)-)-methyltransferase n=1 Tax=Aspergillus chevalieri TaxID=182096 RepID=A0A7R7VRY4_ASPCH|nr:tRNA(Ser) Um(44) 2'-O-methyltransferase [Aspergillus chevalieri]BCR89650.1 tRNA(Ser) Um(44) 2'-O-methyltransferase [Aspergillus chevalieri]
MVRVKQAPRDQSKLTGKPLSETLEPSPLHIFKGIEEEKWSTSPDLLEGNLLFTPKVIDNLTLYLLANPNRMSSHLFRADILHDSLGVLRTPAERERLFADSTGKVALSGDADVADEDDVQPIPARDIAGFELSRTVVRRLIPRKPQLDRPLEQTCHFYGSVYGGYRRLLVVYSPHIASKEELPFYHPLLQSWALLYDYYKPRATSSEEEEGGAGQLSLHFMLYPDEPIQNRLERTLHALLNTQIRLARGSDISTMMPEGGNYKPTKDNVLPRHLVQDTYSRLKQKYASWLCQNWVEDTQPSKHVFEDLSISAFLIELWRSMYGVVPAEERGKDGHDRNFPGFVDVACGNGVLVYVLLIEGYQGWGFDARCRKTWKIFPETVQERLSEEVYIPKPFADILNGPGASTDALDVGAKTHSGIFPKDTFIMSNHADELTVWTPLMAALANPESPLPFMAIPCCSHALSGARYRYPPPKDGKFDEEEENKAHEAEQNPQPATGDLKALRAAKLDAQTDAGANKSMYGCLTAKTMSVAEEIGYDVEKTMLRIPSTRNMAVIGGRQRVTSEWNSKKNKSAVQTGHPDTNVDADSGDEILTLIEEVVRRECAREGGVQEAAKIWKERAKGIHSGRGQSQRH